MMMVDVESAVFVVDDDESVRESIKSLLKSVGLQAEVFGSTEDFMRWNRPELPSCLVLDVRLPGLSGIDFQEALQRSGVRIPIVFITAHGDIPMTMRALKAGAVEFLSKPFQKDELLTAIHQALDRDRTRRQEEAEVSTLRAQFEMAHARERAVNEDMALLKKMARRLSDADPVHVVLDEIVDFVSKVVKCDSCLVYLLQNDELVLRASKNPHPDMVNRLKLKMGQGITGWVAERREPVIVARSAYTDPRFQEFHELPEDRYESFLSVPLVTGGRLVGVINLQDREPDAYSEREVNLMGMIGFLVGAEVERARLEGENSDLANRLESRKIVERAKGILQRELHLTEEEAYLTLQRESRQRRKSMKDVAEAVILSEELKRKE